MLHLNEKWIFFDTTAGYKQHVCTATVCEYDYSDPCKVLAEVWCATPDGQAFKGFMLPVSYNHNEARNYLLKHLEV
ncbi:hypothetical protein [Succinatimonas hippei]|uniref:hypothetical protein n=1 Tax=Succinatimonas hippei TaxID=626938 RepID=UPI0024934757|nr:hypothetical protein [Succinatimonas hippei]